MTGVGILIFVFFVLIAIGLHEFGHFATAKAFGIKVERFFIGFGPKLWSTRKGETEYGISAFPIGGYVRIAGMNPLEEIPPEDMPRTFKAKPAWQRAIVLAAGSITHFLVAILIIASILAAVGEPDPDRPTLVVGTVGQAVAGRSPAELAGLKPGDRIVSVAGVPARDWRQVVNNIRARANETIDIVVDRNGQRMTLPATLTVRKDPETGKEVVDQRTGRPVGFLGVSPKHALLKRSLPSAFGSAAQDVGVGMKDSLIAFQKVFSPSTIGRLFQVAAGQKERSAEDPATLVGIGRISGEAARRGDFATLFLLIAGFNVFVGVANLLPLPPLDGGHLAVLGFEKVTRRDVDMRRLLPVTAMVLAAFGSLFILLLYLDIVKPLPSLPG